MSTEAQRASPDPPPRRHQLRFVETDELERIDESLLKATREIGPESKLRKSLEDARAEVVDELTCRYLQEGLEAQAHQDTRQDSADVLRHGGRRLFMAGKL